MHPACREADRRLTLERTATQRVALSAARTGLPRLVLSAKITPRAFAGVKSPDPVCARHALALVSLAARDAPHMYIEQMAQLLAVNVDIFQRTGA